MPAQVSGFGEQLRRYRERAGLTREVLAERAELTASGIAALERGRRQRPYPDTVRRLADALALEGEERSAFCDARSPTTSEVTASELAMGTPRSNLPAPRTRLIGREEAVAALVALVPAHPGRLVTLTGFGGSGKTRLAIAVASQVRDAFSDGVWFVDLAPVATPQLVLQTVAAVLDVRDAPSRSLAESIVSVLREQTVLLALDNCEHLLDACAALAIALLRACPRLTLIATSREPLGVTGEQVYPVPPLALPPAGGTGQWAIGPGNDAALGKQPSALDAERLLEYPTVALFVERARAVRPEFHLTAANAAAAVQVCRRLDGLPLAIELAAARVRVLTPEQIAARLDDRFRLVAAGGRDTLPRHQTLRALIDWSYDLLSAAEQLLLRRLSVFAGGWTLEAAEAIGAGEGIDAADVLDLLTALVDKSLVVVQQQEEDARYHLLETIRAYALERLAAAGEEGDARGKHLASFARLARTAEPQMEWGAEQLAWLRRIERERDNLHAAIAWAATGADLVAGQRLVTALWRFWWQRGLMAHGRRWLDWALSLPTGPSLRAKLLQLAGQFANWSGEKTTAQTYLEAALTIYRTCDDTAEIAWTLHRLGLTLAERGDPDRGLALCEESIALRRTLDDERGLAYALQTAGNVARMGGDRDRPAVYAEEALALCRASGNQLLTPYPLRQLMVVALTRGDDARARALGEEALALAREIEDPHATLSVLTDLLRLARRQHDLEEAEARGREGLSVLRRVGANQYAEPMLEIMAWAACERGQSERAAVLLGAASALRQSRGGRRDVLDHSAYDETLAAARGALGDERFAAAWAHGQSFSLTAAIAAALPPIESTSEHTAKTDAAEPVAVAPDGELLRASVRRGPPTPSRPNPGGRGWT